MLRSHTGDLLTSQQVRWRGVRRGRLLRSERPSSPGASQLCHQRRLTPKSMQTAITVTRLDGLEDLAPTPKAPPTSASSTRRA